MKTNKKKNSIEWNFWFLIKKENKYIEAKYLDYLQEKQKWINKHVYIYIYIYIYIQLKIRMS
jgi:hypothetical protein